MNELALFAGAGGGILGGKLLGWRTICAVEWEKYPASVLLARQNQKLLPTFPIWDDVQTFDGRPWRGIVDVVSGGFPCQDISSAGRGAGIEGERSSMWKHMARIIKEAEPTYAWIENSAMLVKRGLGTVLKDLAEMGYNAEWGVFSAGAVGANHERQRIWILAYSNLSQCKGRSISSGVHTKNTNLSNPCWWKDSSGIHRMDDGVAARMDRLKAIGNGQVPTVATNAWTSLINRIKNE
jgi:DNA (cytosine-5)-methyltransferase 1